MAPLLLTTHPSSLPALVATLLTTHPSHLPALVATLLTTHHPREQGEDRTNLIINYLPQVTQ